MNIYAKENEQKVIIFCKNFSFNPKKQRIRQSASKKVDFGSTYKLTVGHTLRKEWVRIDEQRPVGGNSLRSGERSVPNTPAYATLTRADLWAELSPLNPLTAANDLHDARFGGNDPLVSGIICMI